MKIPATVITGFLGAGKTTLVRHMLERAQGRRIALIINEFGDVGIDGEILKGCGDALCKEEDVIELSNGCICCTVADDFVPTMTKLLARTTPPDHIVIETSGLALPQPLVRAFNWPEIKPRVSVDAVITVVDAHALSQGRFPVFEANPDHEAPIEELFEDQLNCADMVILNKADLLSESEMNALSFGLGKRVRKGTRLVPAQHGALDVAMLLGLGAGAEDDLANRLSHHEMESEEQHDHDDFITFIVSLGAVADKAALLKRISAATVAHDILRLKGFVDLADAPSRLLIQAVGPRLDSYFDRAWKPGEKRGTELVVIGEKHMDRGAIEAALRG